MLIKFEVKIELPIIRLGSRLLYINLPLLQEHIRLQSMVEQTHQILHLQTLQHIHLTATQKWTNDLERRGIRCCTNQCHHSLFHSTQKTVLLRLREAMNLVNEQDR